LISGRLAIALALIVSAATVGCRTALIQSRPIPAAQTRAALVRLTEDVVLSAAVEEACQRTVEDNGSDLPDMDHIWATVIDLSDPDDPRIGSWHGDEQVYPASVIKTIFMAHTFQQIREGQLGHDWRLRRLLRRMIRVSENIATQHIVDLLSGVKEIERIEDEAAHADWVHARNVTNRFVRELGFTHMNANQKTWDELPDENSVELQFLGGPHRMGYENGNRLTTTEIAVLMWLIDQDLVVSPGACEMMRDLLRRRGFPWRRGDEHRPIGRAMPRHTREWSKGGSTSRFRHDTATVALPDGRRYVLIVFTELRWREGLDRGAVLEDWARTTLELMP
jgi:beta-lactamase class A